MVIVTRRRNGLEFGMRCGFMRNHSKLNVIFNTCKKNYSTSNGKNSIAKTPSDWLSSKKDFGGNIVDGWCELWNQFIQGRWLY